MRKILLSITIILFTFNIGGVNDYHHILYPETATCDLKKLEEGLEPMAIYNEFLRDENKLDIPRLKANELYILTDKKVEVALNDEEEKVFKLPENDGVVFIDRNNKVVRYVDGEKKSVDEKTDEYFTWK